MDWSALREEFPVTRKWGYFDHAGVAPLSVPARDALLEYATDQTDNGVASVRRWIDRVVEVRRLAGQLLNADPCDVAFVKNTSEGIGLVAEGFPWQPGDNVVTAAEEYPANLYPWMNLASRGVELRRVPRLSIDDIRAALDGRTRLLTLSFVEYASGLRNDLDALGLLCRERGILFFVDAIQGLGVFPIDVKRMPIDFLAADGHKWLLGPEGAGLFYIRRELIERLRCVGVGWNSVVGAFDFSTIDFTLKPHAGRWESGSPNVAGITALGASIKLLLDIGIPQVSDRVLALTDHFCDRATRAGLEIFSSRQPGENSGIVSLIVPGVDPKERVQRCRERGFIVNQRAGRLRVSPHCYNSFEEIDRLVEVLRPF